jgi:tRNA (cmo5U34)-methyltransferase
MLAEACQTLRAARVDLRVGRLEEPLPRGPFDLVVSALVVHHLELHQKADLFGRIHAVVRREGRLVLGDVVTPDDPSDAVTPVEPEHDWPDSVEDQLESPRRAGFAPRVAWQRRDLAVMVGDRVTAPPQGAAPPQGEAPQAEAP